MSATSYVSISFSNDLAASGAEDKKEAILKLQDYFESRPEINTGDEIYYPISYALEPLLSGAVDIRGDFKRTVIYAELTQGENVDVQRLGFSTSIVGPRAFSFYTHDRPAEVALL